MYNSYVTCLTHQLLVSHVEAAQCYYFRGELTCVPDESIIIMLQN